MSVNPTVKIYAPREGFGIYGSSLPSSFYRKDESLPPEMRYFDGKPPEVMTFGSAWQGANFELIDKTTEVVPGITLIALVSDAPGTRELRELSLAVNTPDGVVLVVGCSHPGIDKIVEAAAAINPKIHLIAGGFHFVVAPDDAISKTVAALKDTFKVENVAPGHCTGEPTFAALKQAFGDRYIYAGVGTSLALGPSTGAGERRGEGPALEEDDLASYRKLPAARTRSVCGRGVSDNSDRRRSPLVCAGVGRRLERASVVRAPRQGRLAPLTDENLTTRLMTDHALQEVRQSEMPPLNVSRIAVRIAPTHGELSAP